MLISVLPVFCSSDFDATAKFYAAFGYREVGRYQVGYLILRCDGVELHFNTAPHDHDPYKNRQMAYVRVMNIVALQNDWKDVDMPTTDIPRYVPPGLRPWGMIEAHTVDPDGNLLIYGAPSEAIPEAGDD